MFLDKGQNRNYEVVVELTGGIRETKSSTSLAIEIRVTMG